MIRDIPNFIEKSLKENKIFKDFTQKALIKLFDIGVEIIEKNDFFTAKLFNHNLFSYLVVKNEETSSIAIYKQAIDYSDNFKLYTIPSLKNGEEFEESPILYINYKTNYLKSPTEKENKLYEKEILNYLAKYFPDPQYQEYYYDQLLEKDQLYQPFKTVITPYLLKDFFNFLSEEKIINKNFTDEDWLNHLGQDLQQYINQYTDQFGLQIDLLFNVCKNHKFNYDKYFEFNDSYMYLTEEKNKALVIYNGNLTTYTVKEDDTYTIYMCDYDKSCTKFSEIDEIIENLKLNNISLIDNVLLKVVNNEVVYANNALLNSFELDLSFISEDIIKKKLGKIEYPVDINGYDYQLAYHQHKFGMSEFDFLCTAFLIEGFEYNKKKGIFTSYIAGYDSKVVKQEKLKEPEKINTLKFFQNKHKNYPFLEDKWKHGLEYLIEKLTTNKPLPENGTLIQKQTVLDNSISHLENMYDNLLNEAPAVTKKKKCNI